MTASETGCSGCETSRMRRPAEPSATKASRPLTATCHANPGVSKAPTSRGASGCEMSRMRRPAFPSATNARSPASATSCAVPGVSWTAIRVAVGGEAGPSVNHSAESSRSIALLYRRPPRARAGIGASSWTALGCASLRAALASAGSGGRADRGCAAGRRGRRRRRAGSAGRRPRRGSGRTSPSRSGFR